MQLVLVVFLAVLPGAVQAEWLEVFKFDDGMRIFVDQSTLSREGDIAEISHLVRWGEPQVVDKSHVYRSTVVKSTYDCAGKHERYLSSISYEEPMGTGAMILEDENSAESWYTISDSSMEDKLWSIACAANDPQL
jgi:hypothetical protein